jgi:hypothetical protein
MSSTLPDIGSLIQAGIDPKTGLPIKFDDTVLTNLVQPIKKTLRVMDEQNAINRYQWYNLPGNLDGRLVERILYYRGQGMFFYMEADGNFYFLPYALNGTIDVYGRFTGVTPLPFNGTTTDKNQKPWIQGLVRTPVYETKLDITEKDFTDDCVLLWDYSNQMSQTNIARQILNDPIVAAEAEAFPMARTALIANSGVKGVRVNDDTEASNVKAASMSISHAAMTGDPWVPIIGSVDFQDLTQNSTPTAQEYLLYLQALDNYRLSLYGLQNGGLFQKQEHMLQSEEELNDSNSHLVYNDGLLLRQKFCDAVNAIWGLGIWCMPSDNVDGVDRNHDGDTLDEVDQSGVPGDQPEPDESEEAK